MSTSTSTSSRPVIDFSLSRYATARAYAAAHVSRVNKPETNTRLRNVADGQGVDAYDLNEALVDAMRGATTRAGQSPLRRIHGREIAHLHHIVQAVLTAHADGLPAYAEGDRSRAVEDMRAAVTEAQGEIERLTAALREERLRADCLDAEVRENHAQAVAEGAELQSEISRLSRVLGYTRGLLPPDGAAQSLGYDHATDGR